MHYFLYSVRNMGFNIFIFTAGCKEYANAVIQALSLDEYLPKKNIFCREACVMSKTRVIKDLQKLRTPMGHIIHIDNEAGCFHANPDNGVLVPSFRQGMEGTDEILPSLLPLLKAMRGVHDVRHVLRQQQIKSS
jgi:TFIIF-interacting CTD phosphatase-like protein